jgi:hypothetical protein
MTREEKCKLAIQRGYTYDPETGFIYNKYGRILSYTAKNGYIQIGITFNKKSYMIRGHQLAWYYIYNECVEMLDHINGIRTDNRICNLRSINKQQNHFNRVKAKGYTWHKHKNKWQSTICLSGKSYFLGLYKTEEEARNAYLAAKKKYHVI